VPFAQEYEKLYAAAAVVSKQVVDPASYAEAMSGPQATEWRAACDDEMQAFQLYGTAQLVDKPADVRPLPSKWVFKAKRTADGSVERFKARLVVGGHRQRDGIDYEEVFAPVGKYDTLRAMLACAAHQDLELHSLDISNAFLNGVLDEPVYMHVPEGYGNGDPSKCWKLLKALYGLKQAPREWFKVLSEAMRAAGFEQSPHDQALWVCTRGAERTHVLHWVDDLIIMSTTVSGVQRAKQHMLKTFKGRDLGEVTSYLNIVITRDRANRTLKISQPVHIQDLLTKFRMDGCTPRPTPLPASCDFSKTREGEEPCDKTRYAECVGGLLYISGVSRPDITTAASILARHMSNPAERHWTLAKHVMAYLKGTPTLGVVYSGGGSMELQGYTDSEYGGDTDTRRCRGGYVFLLAGGAVAWQSKQQTVVATSTAEAEYIAGAGAARTATWLRRVCTELHGHPQPPVSLLCDNRATLHMAVNSADSSRTKHIDIPYHFLRESVARGVVKPTFVPTGDNVADMFTKPLDRVKFAKFTQGLGMA